MEEEAGEDTQLVSSTSTIDPALRSMCHEYGKYLDFPEINKTQIQTIEDTVENMLARLDEFAAFVDAVRQDSDKSIKLFPLLKERCQQIEKTFPAIDALQRMVGAIKGNLDALDERANAADKLITSLNAEHSQALKWFAKVTNAQPTSVADYKWTPMEFVTAEQFVNTVREARDHPTPPPQTTNPQSATISTSATSPDSNADTLAK